MRRFFSAACALVALLALTPPQMAAAGNGTGAPVTAAEINGVCAVVSSAVDQTTPTTVLSGTRAWNFSIDLESSVGDGLTGSITVNSGYPATQLISEPGKGPFPCGPGTALTTGSLPFTSTAACSGFGGCLSVNLGSDIPAEQVAGYSLVRSASPTRIPRGGGSQTVVVGLDNGLNCDTVAVSSNVPGAMVTSATVVGSWSGTPAFAGPDAFFDQPCAYSGQPVAFIVTFNVPNPFGVPFVSKPEVRLFNGASNDQTSSCSGYAPSTTFDPGPTSTETLFDSTLDGSTAGAGSATSTLSGYSGSWNRSQGCATFVVYQPAPLPSGSSGEGDNQDGDSQ